MSSTFIPSPNSETIRSNSGWFLFLGIVFIIGGFFAIATPFIATLLVTTFIGAALAIIGIMQIIQAWRMRSWGGFTWQLVIGVILLAGGIATWWSPLPAALWLTLVIAVMFVIKGVSQLMLGFHIRPHQGWGWVALAGLISLVVGVMLFADWPLSAFYAIGILAGISFIFTGWSYIMLATAARRAAS